MGDHNANHMSIHAPLTGSDRPTSQLAAVVTRFQSALPMRGATTWYAPVPGTWSDFNPCSLWGERRVFKMPFAYATAFQSTLSVRRATSRANDENDPASISIHALRGESDFGKLYCNAYA